MSLTSQRERPTAVIVEAGEILQKLHPALLGALKLASEDRSLSQADIAEIIGRSRPTVSTYFKTLHSLSLTEKRFQRNLITDTGEKVVSLINRVTGQLGRELDTIDWHDETDIETLSSMLSPLHDSRSIGPFFLLDSLYDRSGIHGHAGTPQPVWVDEVISDVKVREQDRGKNTTTRLVREIIERFEDANVVSFEGTEVELTVPKGHQHAWLVNELIQYLKQQQEGAENVGRTDSSTTDSSTTVEESDDLGTDRLASSDDLRPTFPLHHETLISLQGGDDDAQPVITDWINDVESPTVVPGYCLRSTTEDDEQQFSLVLPIRTRTIDDLIDRATQLREEFDGDTKLISYWMLQIESDLYPLAPTEPSASDR